MAQPHGVDDLPPESRFAFRCMASGAGLDEAAALLRMETDVARNHLRRALRVAGVAVPDRSLGDAALAAAMAAAYPAETTATQRVPGRGCPGDDVAAALATGVLDGPLLLAEIEHAADCPACLERLLALRRAPVPAPPPPAPGRLWPALLGAALGVAAAVVYLFA
jgi:hypothetical protein